MEKVMDGKPRELKLGESFNKDGSLAFHSLRYDFKPASVDVTKMAAVEIQDNNSVTVTVPHVEGSGTLNTVYKGNKRPVQKECVLIIDHNTGQITLEKLSNTIQLKKTSEVADKKQDTNNNIDMEQCLRDSRLVKFAKCHHAEIAAYLEQHKLCKELRPIIKPSYSPDMMKQEHPDIYWKIKRRSRVKANELDSLMAYLVKEFPHHLTNTMLIYEHADRLEDVCDFVLDKVMEVCKKNKK